MLVCCKIMFSKCETKRMTWMELHVVITAILNKNVTLFLKKKKKNNTQKKNKEWLSQIRERISKLGNTSRMKIEKKITVKEKFIWSFLKLLGDFKRGHMKPRKRQHYSVLCLGHSEYSYSKNVTNFWEINSFIS